MVRKIFFLSKELRMSGLGLAAFFAFAFSAESTAFRTVDSNIGASPTIFVDFETGDFQAPGISPLAVPVTRDAGEVVSGKVSLLGSSLNSDKTETAVFSTPPGLLKLGEDVKVSFLYRTLKLEGPFTYFFLSIKSPSLSDSPLSYSTWRGVPGIVAQVEVLVKGVDIDQNDFQIQIGVSGRGSLAIDNLRIQPQGFPLLQRKGLNKNRPPLPSTNIPPVVLAPTNLSDEAKWPFRVDTNCDCEDRDGAGVKDPNRIHQSLTITRVYDNPLRNSFFLDIEDTALREFSDEVRYKPLYFHIKEWFCDQDYKQYDAFFNGVHPRMTLSAPGRRPVTAKVAYYYNNYSFLGDAGQSKRKVVWYGEDNRNIREVVLMVAKDDYIRMPPGVSYQIKPGNFWKDYEWKVDPNCVFVRSSNEAFFPDKDKADDEESFRQALALEKEKKYLAALIQLGRIPYYSPINDEAVVAKKRIQAVIDREIREYKSNWSPY